MDILRGLPEPDGRQRDAANLSGPVMTSGAQSYGNPHGATTVTANLSATDHPITFTDSVSSWWTPL